jgi:hypothetical protein
MNALLDHSEQVIGNGDHVAFLGHQLFEFFIERYRDIRPSLRCTLLAARHGNKKPPAPKGRGRTSKEESGRRSLAGRGSCGAAIPQLRALAVLEVPVQGLNALDAGILDLPVHDL